MSTVKIAGKKVALLEPELIQPVIYSTTEREIGVWTDGKPLYQKTLVVANVGSVGSSLITPIQINDIPFDFVTVIDANIYDSNDKRWYPLSSLMKATGSRIFIAPYLNKDASPVVFYASLYTGGDTFSNLGEFNVTIRYTKTTDTAGSGTWTPQGVPAVHYSEQEHIIGTWIDDKTLYERTFVFPNNVSVTNWTTIMSLSGIDTLVDAESVQSDKSTSCIEYWIDNGVLKGNSLRDNQATDYVKYLTLRYTKSSGN